MARAGGDLRAWLTGLDDVQLRELILVPGPLPYRAKIPLRGPHPRVGRRELLSARAWLSRAPARDLKQIADAAAESAAHLWSQHAEGRPIDPVQPDMDALVAMAEALPPLLARLALHSLLLEDDTPRQRLAEQHWGQLLDAADRVADSWYVEAEPHGDGSDEDLAEHDGDPDSSPWQQEDDTGGAVTNEQTGEPETAVVAAARTVPSAMGDKNGTVDLATALDMLRTRAAQFADALRLAADRVSDGLSLPLALEEEASSWARQREAVARLCQNTGRNWTAEDGFGELQATVDALREEQEREAARTARLSVLTDQRQALQPLLAQAEESGGGVYLDSLRETLRTLEAEIVKLTTADRPDITSQDVPAPRDEETGSDTTAGTTELEAAKAEETTPPAGNGESAQTYAAADTNEPTDTASAVGATKAVAPAESAEPPHATPFADPTGVARYSDGPQAVETTEADEPAEAAHTRRAVHSGEPQAGEGEALTSPDAHAEVSATSEAPALPWQGPDIEGEPASEAAISPVERFVSEGRFQEAYWLTAALRSLPTVRSAWRSPMPPSPAARRRKRHR